MRFQYFRAMLIDFLILTILVLALHIYRVWRAHNTSVDQLTGLSRHLIETQENERSMLVTTLHDSIAPKLILAKNRVTQINHPGHKDSASLSEISHYLTETIQEVREIGYRLRPYQMKMLGLTQSINCLAKEISGQTGIPIKINLTSVDALYPQQSEMNIYRIVQQYLNHITKLPGIEKAFISLRNTGNTVYLDMGKQGCAPNPKIKTDQLVMSSMETRIRILKGSFRVRQMSPDETAICIKLPIQQYANN